MADEEEQQEVAEDENGNKGGMNKLLMIGLLVVGLAIGGGGAFFFLNQSNDAPEGDSLETEEVIEEEAVEVKDLKFVLFEAMAVPIYDTRGKYIGNYKISVKILTANDNDNVKIKNQKFELRHAFNARLIKGGIFLPNSNMLDYDKTANALKLIAKSIAGKNVVVGLVIDDVVRVNN